MNIFVLDREPALCAVYHVDKHVVKMILETTQLLNNALSKHSNLKLPYSVTHKNHPCSIWTCNNVNNYFWLCRLGIELCKEYTYRYEKKHKCQDLLENFYFPNRKYIPNGYMTKFVLAMPDKYKCDDPVRSYRNYYIGEKYKIFKWKKRITPWWIN